MHYPYQLSWLTLPCIILILKRAQNYRRNDDESWQLNQFDQLEVLEEVQVQVHRVVVVAVAAVAGVAVAPGLDLDLGLGPDLGLDLGRSCPGAAGPEPGCHEVWRSPAPGRIRSQSCWP